MSDRALKKILVIQYSQTGQLTRVVQHITAPLRSDATLEISELNLELTRRFPFPWPFMDFFNLFPECVYLDAPPLAPFNMDLEQDFDLIILAYQVWFLAPALPTTALLQSDVAKRLFKNTPVITVIACRNMWTRAQQTVKQMLMSLDARLIDNIVLTDQGSTLASFITTPRWLLTGKKDAFWGLPPAGVAEQEIVASQRFGHAIVAGLKQDQHLTGQPLLSGLGAVHADIGLIVSEILGFRSFRLWGCLLRGLGDQQSKPRKAVLLLYILFLLCMIMTVVPGVLLLRSVFSPLLKTQYTQIKVNYELPSGSGLERMDDFTCQQ